MAYELPQQILGTLTASGDYNDANDQFLCVSSTGTNFTVTATAGMKVLGILQDRPSSGTPGAICIGGVTKARCAMTSHAAIAVMDKLRCSTNGSIMPSSANVNNFVIGRALETLASNTTGIITILFRPEGPGSTSVQSGA
jgi:hypothetical protein